MWLSSSAGRNTPREDPLAHSHGCSFWRSPSWAAARRSAHKGPATPQRTPENLYRAACITCHGPDGTGAPRSIVGFDAPVPDFTDCAFATAEADVDWFSVVHEGGPVRGLDRHMPAFGDALSPGEIALAVSHVRTFCHGLELAKRRPESAADVLHRKGVPRERSGVGDGGDHAR